MKYRVHIIWFFFIGITCSAQLKLEVDKLSISSITYSSDSNESFEGPYLFFECKFINLTDDKIPIYQYGDPLNLIYYYKGSKFIRKLAPFPADRLFDNKLIWDIGPNDTVHFFCGNLIFLGTDLYSGVETDYSELLLNILPTLYIEYKPKNSNLSVFNEKIKNVIVQ